MIFTNIVNVNKNLMGFKNRLTNSLEMEVHMTIL